MKEYLEQLKDIVSSREKAERDSVRTDQRQRLGLGPPPVFRHRSR